LLRCPWRIVEPVSSASGGLVRMRMRTCIDGQPQHEAEAPKQKTHGTCVEVDRLFSSGLSAGGEGGLLASKIQRGTGVARVSKQWGRKGSGQAIARFLILGASAPHPCDPPGRMGQDERAGRAGSRKIDGRTEWSRTWRAVSEMGREYALRAGRCSDGKAAGIQARSPAGRRRCGETSGSSLP
jgi:hypothetical protein